MHTQRNRMKNLLIWTGVLSAIILASFPLQAFSEITQKAVIAEAAADYSSGAHAVVDVEPVGGPRAVQDNLLPTISDIMVAAHENYFYRLERFQRDNVTKFDIAAPDTPVYQYSVLGVDETGSANPYAMIFVDAKKAYVLRYGQTTAWVVNPSAASQAEFKIGEIDLSAYADDDGIPEMAGGVLADGIFYILLQRVDRNNGFAPSNTAYVALFDTATDTEIDTGVTNADGVLGIPLPIKNTSAIQYLAENNTLYVQGAGDAYSFPPKYTGGIVTIDPDSYATTLLVDDGDENENLYGNISGMAIVNADKGYFIGYAGWGDNTLYGFSPTTGAVTGVVSGDLTGKNIAGMQSGAYVDKNNMLWVCNQTDAELVVLDTADDTIDEKIATNLNPVMVAFATVDDGGDGGDGGSDDDDDEGSSCFIDTVFHNISE